MASKMIAAGISVGALPVSVVENPFIRKAIEFISGHKYSMPHRTSMREIIQEHADDVELEIADMLRAAPGISFASDSWSANHKSFFAITATFVDSSWTMRSVVVDIHQFEDSHGSTVMKDLLLNTIRSVRVDSTKIMSLVGDGAASQQKAMRDAWAELFRTAGSRTWCRCLAHLLQTAVRTALDAADPEIQPIKDLIRNVKVVADVFGRSNIAHSALKAAVAGMRDEAIDAGDKIAVDAFRAYSVLGDCVTRWDGTLVLLRRFQRLLKPIQRALEDLNNRKVDRAREGMVAMDALESDDSVRLLAKLIQLLEDLHSITKAAQEVTTSSGSLYYFAWTYILGMRVDGHSAVQHLLHLIHQQVERLEPGLTSPRVPLLEPALLALYLSPQAAFIWPDLVQLRIDAKTEARELVKKAAARRYCSSGEPYRDLLAQPDEEEEAGEREPRGATAKLFRRVRSHTPRPASAADAKASREVSVQSRIRTEMIKYEAIVQSAVAMQSGEDSNGAFWMRHAGQLPLLSGVARAALAYTASSADTERVFSLTGRLMTKRRAGMSVHLLRDSTMIAGNRTRSAQAIAEQLMLMGKTKTARGLLDLMDPENCDNEQQAAVELIDDGVMDDRVLEGCASVVEARREAARARADKKRRRKQEKADTCQQRKWKRAKTAVVAEHKGQQRQAAVDALFSC